MTLSSKLAVTVCLVGLLGATPLCAAPYTYSAGHADVGVGFHDGELELHVHLDAGATVNGVVLADSLEAEPDEVVIYVGESALESRPAAPSYDFIGVAAGEPIYKLAQSAIEAGLEGTPYLGLGTEEIPLGVLEGNLIQLALTGFNGPGDFSMYETGPTRYFDTADGSFANDSFAFPVGTHGHFNMAFTAPGRYEIELTATALLGGEELISTGVYTFQVVPEPSAVALALCGSLGLFWAVRRRK